MSSHRHKLRWPTLALLVLLIAMLLLPNVLWCLSSDEPKQAIQEGLIPGFLGFFLILSLFSRLWLAALVIGLLLLPTLPEIWYVWKFGRPSDSHLLGIIVESDSAEVFSFLRGLWQIIIFGATATVGITVWIVLLLRRNEVKWPPRTRQFVLSSCVVGLLVLHAAVLIPSGVALELQEQQDEYQQLIRHSLYEQLDTYSSSWPLGLPVRVASVLQDRHRLRKIRSELDSFRFGARLRDDSVDAERPIIVLVIGETARPDRWGVFGYERETTPRISAQDNLLIFNDVVSPWAWTRMALPVILTRKPAQHRSPFFAERSLIAAFNEAGYRTWWLSNQNALGAHESSTSLYAHDAVTVRFFNPSSYKNPGAYDDVLLSPLARVLQSADEGQSKSGPGKLIVLHTLGSHFSYIDRYPHSFSRFLPDRPASGFLTLHDSGQTRELNNAYDNSVLFTDHVLGEIIELLVATRRPAILIYVADHGENLFDGECNLSGHGRETELDFRVPMLLWWSDEFARRNQPRIERARINSEAPLSTVTVFHSLLDVADISLVNEDLTKSFFSGEFQAPQRWVNAAGGLDFDTAIRDKSCARLVR